MVSLMKRPKLLCVDDDSGIRQLFRSMFASYGYDVVLASSGRQAVKLLEDGHQEIKAVISDFEMPEMNGGELAEIVKRKYPSIPFIVVSGSPEDLERVSSQVDATIQKGCPVRNLVEQVDIVLANSHPALSSFSTYVSLGSALASAASVAFLLSRLLR
jgi:CheY-like chemotaxis protein